MKHLEESESPENQSAVSCPPELWHAVLEEAKKHLPLPTVQMWLLPLQLKAIDAEQITIISPSVFNQTWVKKHCLETLTAVFKTLLAIEESPTLDIVVSEIPQQLQSAPTLYENRPSLPINNGGHNESPSNNFKPRTLDGLNPRYLFDYFVVGEHNRLAHAAALAVAKSPGASYNPLFLYGGVGLGKTHLMQAIGHYIYQHHSHLNIRYATTEHFTNELIQSIATKSMKAFRERYRRIDVLILDDIQFLEGKDRTQEELFHTFNALHESGKQIILSSDRPPERLSRLEDRLRSRFGGGLIADIQRPDFETRVAILQRKAAAQNIAVNNDISHYLANVYPDNIRELEGALNKLSAYTMLHPGEEITLDNVQSFIGRPFDPTRLSLESILEHVARYYSTSPEDLKSSLRNKQISNIRQIAIYVIREISNASFPQIGNLLGGRKHSTILYSYEKLKEAVANDHSLKQQLHEVLSTLKQKIQ